MLKVRSFALQFVLLSLASISILCTSLVAPALPKISQYYQTIYGEGIAFYIKFIITLPHIMIGLTSIPIGIFVVRRVPRKLCLILLVGVYSFIGVSCSYVSSIYLLLFLRGILGLCSSMIFAISYSLIHDIFIGDERDRVISLITTSFSIGSMVGLFIGGIIADIDWRANFFAYIIPSFYIPFIFMLLDEKKIKNMDKKSDKNQDRKKYSILIVKKIRKGVFGICAIAVFNILMYYFIPLQLPFFMYKDLGIKTAKYISYAMLIENFSTAIVSSFYHKIRTRYSFSSITISCFLLMSFSYSMLSLISQTTPFAYYILCLVMMIYGSAMGLMMPNNYIWSSKYYSQETQAASIGFLNTSLYIGKFMSTFFIEFIYMASGSIGSSYAIASVCITFFTMIVILITIVGNENKYPDRY